MADDNKKVSTEQKKTNPEVDNKNIRDEESLSEDELDAVAGGENRQKFCGSTARTLG